MKTRLRIRSLLALSAAEAADPPSHSTTPPATEKEAAAVVVAVEVEGEREFSGGLTSVNRKK